MNREKKTRFAPPAVGGVSLLVVFAVLCLTIFALLSLTTVQANRRLSDAAAQAVQDYYAADCKAQAVLAWLRTGEGRPELPEDFTVTTSVIDYPDRSESVHAYTIPISDTQELQVEVRVAGAEDYEILRWQAAPSREWQADDSLELWDGEAFE